MSMDPLQNSEPVVQPVEPATPDPQAGAGNGAEPPEAPEATTAALDTVVTQKSQSTVPLPDLGGPPTPPLPDGAVVGERYQVSSFLNSVRDTNLYRVVDTQGYKRCWACGSGSSMPGDTYCVECGAQLTGRYYRLQEFFLPAEASDITPLPIAPAILHGVVPSVARVYDAFQLPDVGRMYAIWEEANGRTLASWLPDGNVPDWMSAQVATSGQLAVTEEPGEEQALTWMAQATEILAALHAEGITGCPLELANLMVQPGGRLLLLDPSACRVTPPDADPQEVASAQASDVRNLATELERWYLAVREDPSATQPHGEASQATSPHDGTAPMGNGSAQMVAADEATGPLSTRSTAAVVLLKAHEGVYTTAASLAQVLNELYEQSKPIDNLQLWSGCASDVGQVRQINEDSVLNLEATVLEHEGNLPIGLYVIADGMGGHQSGEVASSIAVRTIGSLVNSMLIGPLVAGDPVACDVNTCSGLLQQAVIEANRRISDLARERHSDLGTTVTAALMIGNQVSVANVGDSRVYLWHDDQLAPITRDHSLVAQLVAAGQIAPDDIYTHPRRNEIYRALGDARLTTAEVDIFTQRLQPGDGLLLCSDGLWDFVRDPDIAATIRDQENGDPQLTCHALIGRANQAGGEDNISAIFVRVIATAE